MNPTNERDYALIEAAAIAGERCPQSQPFGPLSKTGVTPLCRAGRIRIEIYAPNWRVATILTGPHVGKSTKPAPSGGKPYVIVGKETWRVGDADKSGPPRTGPSAPRDYSKARGA